MKYLLIIMLLLVACQPSIKPLDRYTGEEGLVLTFAEGAPPEFVYEEQAFPVKVEVANRGAQEVLYENMLITFSSNPLYLGAGLAQLDPADADPGTKVIFGKSVAYPLGEVRLYSIPARWSFTARKVFGTIEKPKTELASSICYRYTTTLASEVCIDTSVYEENQRTQSCAAEDLTLSGGQGAPIAITDVKIDAYPVFDAVMEREGVQPSFTVHIKDVGKGQLLGPAELNLADACFLRGIPKEQISTVRAAAWLLDVPLKCTPEYVRLVDGSGSTRCTVATEDLSDPVFAAKQNFMTIFSVNLTYIYRSSASTPVSIIRTPGGGDNLPDTPGKLTGYLYEGDHIVLDGGRPVTLCEHFARHPGEAPSSVIENAIGPDWSCRCTVRQCSYADLSCLPGMCPGDLVCCGEDPVEPEDPDLSTSRSSRDPKSSP